MWCAVNWEDMLASMISKSMDENVNIAYFPLSSISLKTRSGFFFGFPFDNRSNGESWEKKKQEGMKRGSRDSAGSSGTQK